MQQVTRTVLLLTFFCLALAQYPGLEAPTCTGSNILPNSVIQPGYCPKIWASQLGEPRSLEVASNGDILTIESALGRITVLWDANGDGVSSNSERAVLATVTGLNHAVRINGNYVYASNATNVFRWPYQAGDRSNLGPYEIVIKNIPCCHHVTRSLAFDKNNLLYVQVGSGSNVDPDPTHARINQFDIYSQPIPSGGIDFNSGFVYVNGVRNEVGIRFDQNWNLWGVENGVDDLYRADLGGDIHNTNPSEELNFFGTPGLFYGYPYCWTAFNVTDYPTGTQFYQSPEFTGVYNDTWCQDPSNVVVPALSMAAHMAPMDIIFWNTNSWASINSGDAFVALHGSWNRVPPMGYRVEHISYDASGFPVSNTPFLGYKGPGAYAPGWIRPVGLANKDNVLYVSSDQTGQIITIAPV